MMSQRVCGLGHDRLAGRIALPFRCVEPDPVGMNLICGHTQLAPLIALVAVQAADSDPFPVDARKLFDTGDSGEMIIEIWIARNGDGEPPTRDIELVRC